MDTRKEQIVAAAVKRFGHYSYAKTTMNELAEDLGITKANLYYYYADKMALFLDVVKILFEDLYTQEAAIIDEYKKGFMESLMKIIDFRAAHFKKYFALQLNVSENFEWAKGNEAQNMFCCIQEKEIELAFRFFNKAIENKELVLSKPKEAAEVYMEVMRSISFYHKIKDMIAPIPNQEKIDEIVKSQKKVTKFIFEGKIIKQ